MDANAVQYIDDISWHLGSPKNSDHTLYYYFKQICFEGNIITTWIMFTGRDVLHFCTPLSRRAVVGVCRGWTKWKSGSGPEWFCIGNISCLIKVGERLFYLNFNEVNLASFDVFWIPHLSLCISMWSFNHALGATSRYCIARADIVKQMKHLVSEC